MIELRNVSIRAGECSLKDLSLTVEDGEYVSLMGRTGIGKTTILEVICGLRPLESGKIIVNDRDVTSWSPADRGIGYVPQDRALFPTLSVREHLEFALRLRKVGASQIEARVDELSDLLGIRELLCRDVRRLSGGEAQRVALGRALSFHPSVLLLDEPLSALDASTREEVLDLLLQIKASTKTTTIHVTHSQDEAKTLSDRIISVGDDRCLNEESIV